MRPIRNVLYQAWYVLSSLRKPSCTACSADSPIGVVIVVLDVCMQILTCESRISQKSYVLPCRILAFSKARTEQPIWFNESPHPITPEFVWPVFVQPWSSGPPTAIGTFTVYDSTCRRRLSIAREAVCLPFTTDYLLVAAQEIHNTRRRRSHCSRRSHRHLLVAAQSAQLSNAKQKQSQAKQSTSYKSKA